MLYEHMGEGEWQCNNCDIGYYKKFLYDRVAYKDGIHKNPYSSFTRNIKEVNPAFGMKKEEVEWNNRTNKKDIIIQ